MLAVIYLVVLIVLGDSICRRFFTFLSVPHRLASAFLAGVLISGWWTYLSSLIFSASDSPLFWGNIVFFITATGAIYLLNKFPANGGSETITDPDANGFGKWDWIFLGFFFIFVCWLMFGTFAMDDGVLKIANHQWSDFGSTVSIMQSFAQGHNFPTEYPHFTGDRIRYHFLFYFQAGNLEYLGLNPALSNNVLSILSVVSMSVLVMTLGAVTFGSRVVGRLGALLFFFHGTLSFIPYLYAQGSVSNALAAVWKMRDFLPSGFGYRGELWGVWSQVVFANQRHFASSIGIFLIVLVFLMMRYKAVPKRVKPIKKAEPTPPTEIIDIENGEWPNESADSVLETAASESSSVEARQEMLTQNAAETADAVTEDKPETTVETETETNPITDESPDHPFVENLTADGAVTEDTEDAEDAELDGDGDENRTEVVEAPEPRRPWQEIVFSGIGPFIFCGVLLGLLPLWNGAVFTAAFAVLALLFLMFPLRRQMIFLAIATAIVALPQIIFLKTGNIPPSPPIFQWGYTLGNASYFDVFYYLGWTFGVKWILIAIAIITGTWLRNRLMIAISSLIAVTFYLQFSPEALTNHKFLNIWLIVANLFAAAGIWWLWNLKLLKTTIPARLIAGILTVTIVLGGIIDLFPIRNSMWMYMGYKDDPLVRWVMDNTDPRSVFLTNRVVNNGILLSGRRLFNGHTYYAWSAGYATGTRDAVYKRLFESQDPNEVFRLLKENNISYVAFDNGVRKGGFIRNANEDIFKAYFDTVFEDTASDNIRIYAVPAELGQPREGVFVPPAPAVVPAANMFTSGKGTGNGQLDWPRGIATDRKGIVLVADTNNNRIQKFTAEGNFLSSFGSTGDEPGKFREPSSIAVDNKGSIYVADFLNHRIQKLNSEGGPVDQWTGPDPDFAPRDVAIGSDQTIYVADEGKGRIVKLDRSGNVIGTWGTRGTADGEFSQLTSVAVDDKSDRVYVADPRQGRIVVFDRKGTFIANWLIPEWQFVDNAWYLHDIIVDSERKRVYATSTQTDEVIVFDLSGNRLASLKPSPPDTLEGASSLTLWKNKLFVISTFSGRVSAVEIGEIPTVQSSP